MSSRKKNFGEYYLGLDVGTGSVGWCVTDANYNILKKKGKFMCGVRLFDEAESAADRRSHRCSRRRIRRRNERIKLVRDIFKSEIEKIDPHFYMRLDESKFLKEDKKDELKENTPKRCHHFTLFADPNSKDRACRTDRDFYREYPTIYHLRVALMKHGENNDGLKYDIRLYYLAISHFMKHRGYFFQELGNTGKPDFERIFEEFQTYASEEMQVDFELKKEKDVEAIKTILCDNKISNEDKEKRLIRLVSLSSDAQKEAIHAICGLKFDLSKLFDDINIKKTKKSFETLNIDDLKSKDENRFDNKKIEYLEKLQSVYICSRYDALKDGFDTISEAQVARYEKHRRNLEDLRSIVRKYCPEKYVELFSRTDKGNDKKISWIKSFVNSLKGKDLQADETLLRVMSELNKTDDNQFLPNQNNSSIPYRLHQDDLTLILKALVRDYPIFKEKDADGYRACDKILKIFTFQIPYYVGPLSKYPRKNGNSWMIRKAGEETGRIFPWNFDQKVDRERSAEEFLKRMLKDCQKLSGKKVLPKNSLLYSKYMVLNELNNIRFDGKKIPCDAKRVIYEGFFKGGQGCDTKSKKIKLNVLKEWLKTENIHVKELSGVADDTIQSSLKSYHDFKGIIGVIVDTDPLMVESMIYDILVFGDDRNILRKRIEKDANNKLTDDQIDAISRLSYSGWGSFSREFLDGDVKNERGQTIIEALYESNENLEELMSQKHTFQVSVNEQNRGKNLEKESQFFSYQKMCDIAKRFYPSPAVKRSVWQTLMIVNEIRKIQCCDPSRIFIEFAREKQKNPQVTSSRKKRFLELYNSILKDDTEYNDSAESIIKFVNGIEDNGRFRARKLYLYLSQMGKDIYSGKPINQNDIFSGVYNIDHIVPQSIKKDDSLEDNLVLTNMHFNQDEKRAIYPIKSAIVEEQKRWWGFLKKYKLISEEKYRRLIRSEEEELTPDEKVGFINRQLVETRQATKLLKELLEVSTPRSKVFCTKASLVSEFRKVNRFWKSRLINDYHHAKDAYLNIVVGNVYATYFNDPWRMVSKGESYSLRMDKIFKFKVKDNGKITYDLENAANYEIKHGRLVAWSGGEDGTIATVRKTMSMNDILYTRYACKRSKKGNGFWDQKPVSKRSAKLAPLKTSDKRYDTTKFGGYNKQRYNSFVLIELRDKKGRRRILDGTPVSLNNVSEKNTSFKKNNPKILIPSIKVDSLLKVDGVPFHISGNKPDRVILQNAVQLYVNQDIEEIICRIERFMKKYSSDPDVRFDDLNDYLSEDNLIQVYDFLTKKIKSKIFNLRLTGGIPEKIETGKEYFSKLDIKEKCDLIIRILKLFECRNEKIDLKDLNIDSAERAIRKDLSSNYKSVKLVHQSVTGLYEHEVDLLTTKADE